MLRHATTLALLIVSSMSISSSSQSVLQASTLLWAFPVDPSANVDELCMFDCARSSNYDNFCYWKCGIDPQCKWGSMLKCADARPDRQLNCVVDTGCLDFVEHYIRKKQQTQPSQSTRTVINASQDTSSLFLEKSKSLRVNSIKCVVVIIGVLSLLVASILLTWLFVRKEGGKQKKEKEPKQQVADCYVLLTPEEGVSDT